MEVSIMCVQIAVTAAGHLMPFGQIGANRVAKLKFEI
jgi:hypothetical protein